MYEKSLKYINMGFTGMFSVETVLKIIGFGFKVSYISIPAQYYLNSALLLNIKS